MMDEKEDDHENGKPGWPSRRLCPVEEGQTSRHVFTEEVKSQVLVLCTSTYMDVLSHILSYQRSNTTPHTP